MKNVKYVSIHMHLYFENMIILFTGNPFSLTLEHLSDAFPESSFNIRVKQLNDLRRW